MRIEFLKHYGDQRPGDVYDHQHGGVADMLIRRGIAKLLPDLPVVEVPSVVAESVTVTPDSPTPTEPVVEVPVPKTPRKK